ncbi:unnamed protein product [Eretmochelys imbricata]
MTGEEIFRVKTAYFEEGELHWKNCLSVCTDGTGSMTGKVKGFVSKVKEQNFGVPVTHCFLHREDLMAKTLPKELSLLLDEAIKILNLIKSQSLKCCLFLLLCEEMGAEHQSLILHTEIRWLFHGKVLSCLYELREELKMFLT